MPPSHVGVKKKRDEEGKTLPRRVGVKRKHPLNTKTCPTGHVFVFNGCGGT